MGVFRPGMFKRRDASPKQQDAPARPPVRCEVCGLEGHLRDDCWTAVRTSADVGRTWRRSGSPEQSSGTGPTFDEMREFWRRFSGGGD